MDSSFFKQQVPSSSTQTRDASPETVGSVEKYEGMFVEALNANYCFDDIPAGFQDSEHFPYGDASKDTFEFEKPSETNSLSNSERTLEKWEYLLRTRPRDPM